VRECISRTRDVVIARIEGQDALNVRRVLFVLLRKRSINAELQRVVANDLGDGIAICVNGIGVVPWEVPRVRAEAAAVRRVIAERDRGKLSAETIVEESSHRERRRERRVVKRVQENVVSRV